MAARYPLVLNGSQIQELQTGDTINLTSPLSPALGGTGVTTSTGTGSVVLSTSPTLVTPILGTPTSVTLTNATGLPLTTGVTGTLPIANGGTNATTASAAFNALSPITTTGDLIIGNGTNSATRLAIGANTYVLTSNGTTASWVAPSSGSGSSISNGTSNVTVNSSGGTVTVATAGTTALTVDTSQNLGIGTSSPDQALVVNKASSSTYLKISGANNALYDLGLQFTDGSNVSYFGQLRGTLSGTAGALVSITGGAIRTVLDSSGNLLIGYTSSNGAYKLQVNSQIFATSSTIATSDARYKTNVTPISNGLALINKLNPVSFDWKEHSVHNFDTKNTNVGFLAQDVQEILKDEIYLNSVIRKNETKLPDGTKEEFLGLSDSSLIPILVKAIQELTTRLTVLENK